MGCLSLYGTLWVVLLGSIAVAENSHSLVAAWGIATANSTQGCL